jgi:hypothetical protein
MKMNRNFKAFIDFISLELEVPTICLVTGGVSGRRERRYTLTNPFHAPPAFRPGCTGDNYLGVSSDNLHLSSIKDIVLSILSIDSDIADFSPLDIDESDPSVSHPVLYNRSYQAFLKSALNINPSLNKVDLPKREEGLIYAEWYFCIINPFHPILHKTSFMCLVSYYGHRL